MIRSVISRPSFSDYTISHTPLQSINVIENPQLRAIFMILREELRDEDISHGTTIRNRILRVWDGYVDNPASEMKARFLTFSLTLS
jgi:hypothetical protein